MLADRIGGTVRTWNLSSLRFQLASGFKTFRCKFRSTDVIAMEFALRKNLKSLLWHPLTIRLQTQPLHLKFETLEFALIEAYIRIVEDVCEHLVIRMHVLAKSLGDRFSDDSIGVDFEAGQPP